MPSATMLRYEWIVDARRFIELQDQWNLLGSSAIETVFLTHGWLRSWLEELAPDAELHVLTAWDGERLVAVLPLFGNPAVGRGRIWAIMGTGTLTPNHLDVIAEPTFLEQARARFVDMLLEERARWDTVEFDKLPAESLTLAAFEAAFVQAGLSTQRVISAICPFCVLPPTLEEYIASRKKRVRKKIRQVRRLFAENPEAHTFRLAQSESEALEMLAELVRLHQARWEGKGYPGAFADPRVVRFHEALVRRAFAGGYLRIYSICDGDEVVAVSYDFVVGTIVQAYLSSFDPRWADWSPGVLMRILILEHSIEEGATVFDFLEGDESYKVDWCTSERENLRLTVFNRTLRGRISHLRQSTRESAVRFARRWVPQSVRERMVKVLASRSASRPSDGEDS